MISHTHDLTLRIDTPLRRTARPATCTTQTIPSLPPKCPVQGRASQWDNDYEAFVAEWFNRAATAPSVPLITATLNARGFTMQSNRKRRVSLYVVDHLLSRMYYEGLI